MLVVKGGDNPPELNTMFESVATVEAARVTVIVYVAVVTPSAPVTTIGIALGPTFKDCGADADPDVTVTPLTFMVAVELVGRVGVTVTDVVALVAVAVYDNTPVAKVGDKPVAVVVRFWSDVLFELVENVSGLLAFVAVR